MNTLIVDLSDTPIRTISPEKAQEILDSLESKKFEKVEKRNKKKKKK